MTRKELIAKAEARGFLLSGRTLRWWERKGLLPRPTLLGDGKQKADYSSQTLDKACFLVELKGKSLEEKRKELGSLKELSYASGYGLLEVEELVEQIRDGQIYAFKKLKNGDLVVSVRRRR